MSKNNIDRIFLKNGYIKIQAPNKIYYFNLRTANFLSVKKADDNYKMVINYDKAKVIILADEDSIVQDIIISKHEY